MPITNLLPILQISFSIDSVRQMFNSNCPSLPDKIIASLRDANEIEVEFFFPLGKSKRQDRLYLSPIFNSDH